MRVEARSGSSLNNVAGVAPYHTNSCVQIVTVALPQPLSPSARVPGKGKSGPNAIRQLARPSRASCVRYATPQTAAPARKGGHEQHRETSRGEHAGEHRDANRLAR